MRARIAGLMVLLIMAFLLASSTPAWKRRVYIQFAGNTTSTTITCEISVDHFMVLNLMAGDEAWTRGLCASAIRSNTNTLPAVGEITEHLVWRSLVLFATNTRMFVVETLSFSPLPVHPKRFMLLHHTTTRVLL
jgi:hypothetical protein